MRSRTALPGVVVVFVFLARLALASGLGALDVGLDRESLRALGVSDDSWQVPVLERAFDRRAQRLLDFPPPLYPPDLEEELVAALESLERLDPPSAGERARALLEASTCDCPSTWAARRVLARNGDLSMVRQALGSFFDASEKWGALLAQSDDLRLAEFRGDSDSSPQEEVESERRLHTELERNLARATDREAICALLDWASTASDPASPRRVLEALPGNIPYKAKVEAWLRRNPKKVEPPASSLFDGTEEPLRIQWLVLSLLPGERYRATRWLVERDHPALLGLPMSDEDIDRLYPYLVRSSTRAIRQRAWRSRGSRGRALASYLASPSANVEEKRETLAAMRDARADAVAAAGTKTFELMEVLVGEEEAASFVREERSDERFLDALTAVPLDEARERLEEIGSPAAIERLMKRSDRILSFPFLDRLRRGPNPRVARAAAIALVSLGAPGASAILRTEMASSAASELDPAFLAAALKDRLDPALVAEVVFRAGSDPRRSPACFAALYHVMEGSSFSMASLLSSGNRALVERAFLVLSLAGDRRRLPLLVDLATGATERSSERSREAAFSALAESDLGEIATRLHRLAGDPDRAVRFRAAAALAPSGEPWAMRLLLGNLDETSAPERRMARAAISQLPRSHARSLLKEMILDSTAGSFGVLAFLQLSDPAEVRSDRPLQRKLWELVAEEAEAGDPVALRAASRLSLGEAIRAVGRRLTAESVERVVS